jgi:plastocyanin
MKHNTGFNVMKFKRGPLISVLGVLSVVTLCCLANAKDSKDARDAGENGAAVTRTVIMKSISYAPKELEVKVGDSVQWQNKSYTEHSSTQNEGLFDTELIAPGKFSKKVKFDKVGTYKYHCSMHGKSMSGKITVVKELTGP